MPVLPAFAIDQLATAGMYDLINKCKTDNTIVIGTHYILQASRVADVSAFMYLGDLLVYGNTDTIFTNPSRSETEDYITGKFG